MSGLRLAAGQCTLDVAILLVGQAVLQLRTLAARSRVCGEIAWIASPAGAPGMGPEMAPRNGTGLPIAYPFPFPPF